MKCGSTMAPSPSSRLKLKDERIEENKYVTNTQTNFNKILLNTSTLIFSLLVQSRQYCANKTTISNTKDDRDACKTNMTNTLKRKERLKRLLDYLTLNTYLKKLLPHYELHVN